MTAGADDLPKAIDAAWELNRYIEGDVEVIDNAPYDADKDDYSAPPRRVALVSVTFYE